MISKIESFREHTCVMSLFEGCMMLRTAEVEVLRPFSTRSHMMCLLKQLIRARRAEPQRTRRRHLPYYLRRHLSLTTPDMTPCAPDISSTPGTSRYPMSRLSPTRLPDAERPASHFTPIRGKELEPGGGKCCEHVGQSTCSFPIHVGHSS